MKHYLLHVMGRTVILRHGDTLGPIHTGRAAYNWEYYNCDYKEWRESFRLKSKYYVKQRFDSFVKITETEVDIFKDNMVKQPR